MSRRGKKKGRPVSGWVMLDKPVGMGSTEAVSKIKWLFQAERPDMPARSIRWPPACCRSRSAKRPRPFPTCQDGAKIYRFTVAWGEERSTDDLEGPVTRRRTSGLSEADDPRDRCRNIPA